MTKEEFRKLTENILILDGATGAKRNAVMLNAGAGLYIGGAADSLEAGIKLAGELIDSGAAKAKLDDFVRYSNEV